MKTYSLFEGRHALPENLGAIASDFNFSTFRTERTPLWEEAIQSLIKGEDVGLLVTGLTPALAEFMMEVTSVKVQYYYKVGVSEGHLEAGGPFSDPPEKCGMLTLYHFNRDKEEYTGVTY